MVHWNSKALVILGGDIKSSSHAFYLHAWGCVYEHTLSQENIKLDRFF